VPANALQRSARAHDDVALIGRFLINVALELESSASMVLVQNWTADLKKCLLGPKLPVD
jgi:hypothetical protein